MEKANKYLTEMRSAVYGRLNTIYEGKERHLQFARECGAALPDFDEQEQKEILSASYGSIYIIGCNLKPILDAKEWITEMQKGKEKMLQYRIVRNKNGNIIQVI